MQIIQIPLTITNNTELERDNEPVSIGVPLPRSLVYEASMLGIKNHDDNYIPVQGTILSRWPDRSIKWVLLDFQISLTGDSKKVIYVVNHEAKPKGTSPQVCIEETSGLYLVDTGTTRFALDKKDFYPFKNVTTQDGTILCQRSRFFLIDLNGTHYHPQIMNSTLDISGPIRSSIFFEGVFVSETGLSYANFKASMSFYKLQSIARLDFTIHNPNPAKHYDGLWDLGDSGSLYFKEMALNLTIEGENDTTRKLIIYSTESLENFQSYSSDFLLYQDSSGGMNWNSTNHVDRRNELPLSFKGYRVYDSENNIIVEGDRAQPSVSIISGSKYISASIKNFWQNFPKSIQSSGHEITLGVFPNYNDKEYELQGGEQKEHTMFFSFSETPASISWINNPLTPAVDPAWIEQSRVFPYLTVASVSRNSVSEQLIEESLKGPKSIISGREVIDEYGWRNFGDIFANHETYEQKDFNKPKPLVSHYNNQYDMIYGFLYQYARSGNPEWFKLADELAHHVRDIDIYRTTKDRAVFNEGLFFHTDHFVDAATSTHRSMSISTKIKNNLKSYGGGPSYDHIYTRGLLYHYYLTGEISSKNSVLCQAHWAIKGIDGVMTFSEYCQNIVKRVLVVSKWLILRKRPIQPYIFNGPGRPSGNCLKVLIDTYQLTGEQYYIDKSWQLIRKCIHPEDDIESRNLSDPNARWMYLIFLQALGDYLDLKHCLGQIDKKFIYCQQSLLRYTEWMLENETPFLSKPELLDHPNFATRASQDLRKCNVFLYAYKYGEGEKRDAYFEKAKFFFDSTMESLKELKTANLVRPIAIQLQNAGVLNYFEQNAGKFDKQASSITSSLYDIPALERGSIREVLLNEAKQIRCIVKNFSLGAEKRFLKRKLEEFSRKLQTQKE